MTTVNVTTAVMPNLPPRRWARNGQYPAAWLAQQLAARANSLIFTKGKEVFRRSSGLNNIPTGVVAGTTDRWRFAFHASATASHLYAQIIMAPTGGIGDGYTRIRIFDSTGLVTLGDAVMHFPANSIAHATPAYYKTALVPVVDTSTNLLTFLTGNAQYLGVVSDIDSAHVSAISLWEVPVVADTANGYLDPGVGIQSPVTAAFRQNLATQIASQWKVGSRHLFSWCVEKETTPRTIAVNTATNLIDSTTTGAPTAATPGHYLDATTCMRAKDAASGIAAKIRVYGKCTSAGNGVVTLVNSAGTAVATVSGFSTTAGWSTATAFFLNANDIKYDLQFKTASGTLSVYAVSVYLHE